MSCHRNNFDKIGFLFSLDCHPSGDLFLCDNVDNKLKQNQVVRQETVSHEHNDHHGVVQHEMRKFKWGNGKRKEK